MSFLYKNNTKKLDRFYLTNLRSFQYYAIEFMTEEECERRNEWLKFQSRAMRWLTEAEIQSIGARS
jgi:hypothetical protein